MRDLARASGVLTTKDDAVTYIAHGINEDSAIPVPVLANAASMGHGSELLSEFVMRNVFTGEQVAIDITP